MRRWGAWSRFFGKNAGGAQKRAANRLKYGHTKGSLMIRTDLYRWLTSCGSGVGAAKRRTNSHQASYRYHEITLPY
jgi:hypothetical protein